MTSRPLSLSRVQVVEPHLAARRFDDLAGDMGQWLALPICVLTDS